MSTQVPQDNFAAMPFFQVEKQIELDGIGMGILENGIAYLTESGLSAMCGIDRKALNRLAQEYESGELKARAKEIESILHASGYYERCLYLKSVNNGREINAYPGPVCLSILEYYAFSATDSKEQALKAYRTLAKVSFDDFIYQAVGYRPQRETAGSWQAFHDRVDLTLDVVPRGYFCIFRESNVMIPPLIRSGVPINSKTVPDISVGIAWKKYWDKIDGDKKFGESVRYQHNYPDYFPQSKSNPQKPHAYPDAALGEYRKWFHEIYLPTIFPNYILNQKGKITAQTAERAIKAITGKILKLK